MATTAEMSRLQTAGFTTAQVEALDVFLHAGVAMKTDVAAVRVEISRLRSLATGLRGQIYRAIGLQTLVILAAILVVLL